MHRASSQTGMLDLIVQLEEILGALDKLGEKMAAIKVDEAIATLCDDRKVSRSGQNLVEQLPFPP